MASLGTPEAGVAAGAGLGAADAATTRKSAREVLKSGPIARILRSAGARILILPLSGAAALLSARLVTDHFGTQQFALFSLAASLPFLIPLTDLGLGAALTNSAAALPAHPFDFRQLLRRIRRILWVTGLTVCAVAAGLGALGLWPALLSISPSSLNCAVAGAVALIGLSIPGSLGARILLGLRRNALVVLIQGLTPVVTLVAVLLIATTGMDAGLLLPGAILGLVVTNWTCSVIAARTGAVKRTRRAVTPASGATRPAVWTTAVPMLVISFALPVTFQTDRLVLSWNSTLDQLSIYAAAALVFLPITSVIQVGGRSLWGDFAAARATGADVRALYRTSLTVCGVAGLVGAVALVLLGPAVAAFATGGQVPTPLPVFLAFGLVVVLQAVQAPSGMYLTSPAGLRFQAITCVLMAVVSLPLSMVLATPLGAIGPIVATVMALLFCHVLPCLYKSRRSMVPPNTLLDNVDRVIVEHLDPAALVPGGIDTCIHDLIRYSGEVNFAVVGITDDPAVPVGVWTSTEIAGRSIPFLPVARFDRSTRVGVRGLLPHSVRMAFGTIRFRGLLPRVVLQAHRIETGALLSLLRGRHFIQFIHNDSRGLVGEHSDSSWKGLGLAYRLVERRVMRTATGVVLFNAPDSVRLRMIRPDLRVATTWFCPEVFALRGDDSVPDELRICWIGRFEEQKDPLLAVRTFACIINDAPSSTLIMVGSGSLRPDIVELAGQLGLSGSLVLSGSLTRQRVAEVMAASSSMLMTSHYEGSPRVMAEAGAVGLPVVATSGADPDQLLRKGSNGIRVNGRDPRELAGAVMEARGYSRVDCADAVASRSAPDAISALLRVGV